MEKDALLIFVILSIFLLNIGFVNAYPIVASVNKITFALNEQLTVEGSVNGTGDVSAVIYNSSGTAKDLGTASISSSGSFNFSYTIDNSFTPPGDYNLVMTSGEDNINMSFKVVSQLIILEANLINSGNDVINISTSIEVQTANSLGGNFTEMLSLSKSSTQKIHYGNYSIGGKVYHFVLVDQNNATVYDRLYVDDDKNFSLFNDTEDAGNDVEYQELRKGSVFSNGTFRYIVGEIEKTTGNKIILWTPPTGKPPYSTSDTVNFIIIARNGTNLLSQAVSVDVLNSTGQNITPTNTYNTGNFGWINGSISLSSVPANMYIVSLNNSFGIMPFPVEAFKLFATVNDLSNNPTSSFAPNSQARIIITSMNSSGTLNLTTFTSTVYYPTGTTVSKTKNDFTQVTDGIYRYDLDLTGAPTGSYSVSIIGSDGTNSQTASTGFEIQSVSFEAQAINTRYIEETEGSESTVNAFAPNSNVTIMTFLSNISAGGTSAKGPEGFTGLLTPGDCNSAVTLVEVKDENGDSYSVNYLSMNLSSALQYLSGEIPEDVPPDFLSQCMIIFQTPSKNGIYTAEVKINYQGEERYSGVTFGVQRVWVEGKTVDFKGEDFGFIAPNSTVRIKLKVTDLVTDEELPATNITSAKVIELYKVFPSFKDVLGNSTLRNNLNESIVNGTISFTSPTDEGFYMMKFRFTADVAGNAEIGVGDAFFMLKKYMVWSNLAGAEQGQWFIKQGQNITLSVTVLDIDKAQTYFGGYNTQKTCTDCGGFIISVSELRNDQQFKKVTGYTVETGTITNSTNPTVNITIVPTAGTDMQTGWYSVDLIVTDSITSATYFGWGGFEMRNFWVDVQKVTWNGTDYTMMSNQKGSSKGGEVFAVGNPVTFAIFPREPNTPTIYTPDNISMESIQWFVGWPPVPLAGYTVTGTESPTNILICDENMCQVVQAYVVNITGLPTDKKGDFQANVKVNINGTSDVGSFQFSTSTYNIETNYRADSWPPLFSKSENLTVNFTAQDFDENPYNITNVTIDGFYSIKLQRPIKMRYGQNYTTYCPASNFCQINVNLSYLISGEYDARFAVVDETGDQKIQEVFFKVQDVIVSIPSLEEAWIRESDSVSRKIDNNVRRGDWTWCQMNRSDTPNRATLCADYCPAGSQCQEYLLLVPNVSYSKEIFGRISLMEDGRTGEFGSVANKSMMWMYANGTHMWINATPDLIDNRSDLGQTTPVAINENFRDSKGGIWRLDSIGDQSITVSGITSIYGTGVLINTSYSKSGVIKLGQIMESQLGAFTQQGRSGIDLNGDGSTSGTVYFAIADNAIAGVYDTFFFSKDGNFTGLASPTVSNPISLNDPNRESRTFGFGRNLTLLSIDAKAQGLKFYSQQIGDWAHLGEIKSNLNITIPIIVAAPDGTPRSALISVVGYKNMRNWKMNQTILMSNINITGVGEIKINSSTLSGTGEYSFAIQADGNPMEEWKWPIATVRGYLVDGEIGEAFYVSDFKPLDLREYRQGTQGVNIMRIYRDWTNETSVVNGMATNVQSFNPISDHINCQVYNTTNNITDLILQQPSTYLFLRDWYHLLRDWGTNYYYFYNSSDGTLYRNINNCWFNVSDDTQIKYHEGESILFNVNGVDMNFSVLKIDIYDYCCGGLWRADFGVPGINSNVINYMTDNQYGPPRKFWSYMQNLSIFGTRYDVVLAADPTINITRCQLQPPQDGSCIKRAWIVPRSFGNFSNPATRNATAGQNFTKDLYISSIGANENDGITVGNFSQIASFGFSPLPIITGMPFADDTTSYFNVLNETTLGFDLDKNSTKNTTFYMLAFDSEFDGKQNLTSVVVDDDLELVTWSVNMNGLETKIDLTSNETWANAPYNWMEEKWGNLPKGLSSGSVSFGGQYENRQWEQQPEWNVPFYNNTHMLIKKDGWRFNNTQSITVPMKVYNFDQTAVQGANLSIIQMATSSPWLGFQLLSSQNYTVNKTYNSTDRYGYGMLTIQPNPSTTRAWINGQYQVLIKIEAPQGTETWERWFCIGGCNQ